MNYLSLARNLRSGTVLYHGTTVSAGSGDGKRRRLHPLACTGRVTGEEGRGRGGDQDRNENDRPDKTPCRRQVE